jgi:uncharacterized membrane protein YgcG
MVERSVTEPTAGNRKSFTAARSVKDGVTGYGKGTIYIQGNRGGFGGGMSGGGGASGKW